MSFTGKNIVAGALVATALATSAHAAEKKLTGDISIAATSSYFYQGVHQEDSGLILQPAVNLNFSLFSDGNGVVKSLDLNAGLWNSIHSSNTGVAGGADKDSLYETDYTFGLTANLGDKIELSVGFADLTSPNNAFGTVQEIRVGAQLICQDVCGGKISKFNPRIDVVFETSGTAVGTDEGIGVNLSINPELTFLNDFAVKGLTASLPVRVGLGFDDYYRTAAGGDETFGYLDAGVDFELPLNNVMPAGYGQWTLNTGVHGIYLNDNLERVNRGDNFEVYGFVGLKLAF